MFEQEEEWVSKTRMKKQMNDLQDLGMALTKLSPDTLKKIGLDEELLEAVLAYKKITSNGALKRQGQFIGRLMRDTDPAPIEAFLAKLRGDNAAHNAFLQRIEQHEKRAGTKQTAEKLPRPVSRNQGRDGRQRGRRCGRSTGLGRIKIG